MLSNRISCLQGGSQLGQLAPFINHTNGSRRLCSTLQDDKETRRFTRSSLNRMESTGSHWGGNVSD